MGRKFKEEQREINREMDGMNQRIFSSFLLMKSQNMKEDEMTHKKKGKIRDSLRLIYPSFRVKVLYNEQNKWKSWERLKEKKRINKQGLRQRKYLKIIYELFSILQNFNLFQIDFHLVCGSF